ncbi:endolytic transglycosylase MltG [Streptomyces nodosus]|uniref:endolytic transglycosylase MltG n=1 Tax=Streptomyces nodosus TaxID=40318 RepID=UPI003452DF79
MTEYGRGPGSAPWHPEDPLYGDGGWEGQGQPAQSPYGDQPQHYPEQHQQHQQQYGGGWDGGGQPGYDQGQQGYQQYPDQGHAQYQQPQQYQQQGGQPYPGQPQQPGPQQYAGQPQAGGPPYQGHPQQGHPQQAHPQQGGQPYPGQPQQYPGQQEMGGQYYPGGPQQNHGDGGWNGGGQPPMPYPGDAGDPYGAQAGGYGTGQPDPQQVPDTYPSPESSPEPSDRRRAEPEPEPETDWDPGPDQGEHAFFADADDDEDDEDEAPRGSRGRGDRRGRGGKGDKTKKRRSGTACLVVVLVVGGGTGGIGYLGYQFYQSHFGAAPDYAGEGNGEQISVTIPDGSGGYTIGQLLKKAGVVKSVDAFVAAQEQNPQGKTIQAGTYLLSKEMSAASAVQLMLSPKSKNNLIIAEGWRNVKVYAAIDDRLKLKAGTTQGIAEKEWKSLGLPSWANTNKEIKDPLEGFLFPSSYPVTKGMKPEDVLKQMIGTAKKKYADFGLESKASKFDLKNPLELLTVASLVQAEGKTHDDYRKMAEVVYNRLKPDNTETYQLLQFDSTFNYLKGQSNIHISESEINSNKDPYNTYTQKGLPPGPIGNPGAEALSAALDPTHDGWIYFVATDGVSKTEFAKTHAEFLKLKDKFDALRKQ